MDVFRLRHRLVDDYGSYVNSFIQIKDDRVAEEVRNSLAAGLLWPDPLIQLNPSFETGETIDELVGEGTLHEECSRIFRRKKKPDDPGEELRLHRHQADAIRTARGGHNYVLTTDRRRGLEPRSLGTGSDHVRAPGSQETRESCRRLIHRRVFEAILRRRHKRFSQHVYEEVARPLSAPESL